MAALWMGASLLIACATSGVVGPAADPVIIVAGTLSPASVNELLARRLRKDGYEAWVFELVAKGTADIDTSARALAVRVSEVLARTGASHVDLIGHSQGAIVARHYIKSHGGADRVDDYIGLAGPQYGSSVAKLVPRPFIACEQMEPGSAFLEALNADDDTPGAATYTTVYTIFDAFVRPLESATLRDGAANVKVQDLCPARVVTHLGLILDGTVYSIVESVLSKGTVDADCWD
jgi:triacylglycerol lipase